MKYTVSSATILTGRNMNRDRCFELNAVDLPSLEVARIEADRRNAIEQAAGHTNIEWYASEQIDFAAILAQVQSAQVRS